MKLWMLFLALMLLCLPTLAEEPISPNLDIALKGAGDEVLTVVDERVSLPDAVLEAIGIENQAGPLPGAIEPDTAQALYDALLEGKVLREVEVSPPVTSRKTDGARITLNLLRGEDGVNVHIDSIYNKDGVIVSIGAVREEYQLNSYAVESKALKDLVLSICQHTNFPREDVQTATKVVLSVRRDERQPYEQRTVIEDSSAVKQLIDIVLAGKLDYRQQDWECAMIRMDFVMPDGSIRSAYTPWSGSYRTMVIGGVRLNYDEGDLDPIYDHIR